MLKVDLSKVSTWELEKELKKRKMAQTVCSDEQFFEISPIKIGRGAYSASRYLYYSIKINRDDIICSVCPDVDSLILNHINGILLFNRELKKEELAVMGIKNWAFGKSRHGRCEIKPGIIFDENSYFLAVADADSEALIKIAEKLCLKSAQKAVLLKICNAREMFLVSIT